jgi:hypothetical protein
MAEKITSQMKKEISKEWQKEFSSMSPLRTLEFGNVLGCFLVVLSMREHRIDISYTPEIYVNILCREIPYIVKSLTFDTGYIVHSYKPHDKYLRNVEKLKQKCVIPVEGDVTLQLVLKNLEEYFTSQESYYRDVLEGKFQNIYVNEILEMIMYVSGWSGVESAIKEAEDFVEEKIKNFDSDYCLQKPSIEFVENAPFIESSQWFKEMKEIIRQTEKLRETVDKQINFFKLNKIPFREILK